MEDNRAKRMDQRTVGRYIDKGIVTETEYKDFLKNLPDDTANAQFVQMDLHDAELNGEEADADDETDEESDSEDASEDA